MSKRLMPDDFSASVGPGRASFLALKRMDLKVSEVSLSRMGGGGADGGVGAETVGFFDDVGDLRDGGDGSTVLGRGKQWLKNAVIGIFCSGFGRVRAVNFIVSEGEAEDADVE